MSGALLNQAVCGALYRPLNGREGGGEGGGGGVGAGKKKTKNGKRKAENGKLNGLDCDKIAPERQRLVQTIAKLEEENPEKGLNVAIIPHPEKAHR